MNYLAHAYLSFGHEEILIGNMISDFVKGKKKFNYPENIQKGITLHRAIDTFTDDHPETKKAKNIFRPSYRLYSGAFIDIVYDHFLANDSREFSKPSLQEFSQEVYAVLEKRKQFLPPDFAAMFPYMKMHNWLYNYSTHQGIIASFGGLVRRASYIEESNTAAMLFRENYEELQQHYDHFFIDLKQFAQKMYQEILKM